MQTSAQMQRTESSFRAAGVTPNKVSQELLSPEGSTFSIKSFRPSKIPSPLQKDAATPAEKIMKKQVVIY